MPRLEGKRAIITGGAIDESAAQMGGLDLCVASAGVTLASIAATRPSPDGGMTSATGGG